GLGADEAALEVGVNHAGCLGCGVAHADCPGAHFLDPGREVGLQTQQCVRSTDHTVQTRLVHAHVGQEHVSVFVVELGNLSLDRRTNGHHWCVLSGGVFAHRIKVRVVLETVFTHVGHVHAAFGRNEAVLTDHGRFVFVEIERTNCTTLVQRGNDLFEHGDQLDCFLVARTCKLQVTLQRLFSGRQVSQRQLGIDDFDIAHGVDTAGHVHDVFVFEATHHMNHSV